MPIDVQAGIGPNLAEGPQTLSAGLMRPWIELYSSPLLDLTQAASGLELIPAKPGLFPYGTIIAFTWVIEQIIGVQTTPLQCRAGSNTARTNFAALTTTTPSNATVNAGTVAPFTAGGVGTTLSLSRIPGATVYLDIVAGAVGTGGFKLMGRFTAIVMWVAVGG